MFVVSVPYGLFNKTSQATIYLKKKKKKGKKSKHIQTKDHLFVQVPSINYYFWRQK